MLRTTRPLLSSANRLAVAGRVPHVRPTQLPTCAVLAPQARPQLHKQAAAGQSKAFPIVFWARYSSKVPLQPTKIDKQHEKELAQQKLEARPDEVSGVSSVRPLLEESQAPKPPPDEDPLRGLKGDLHTFKETFDLQSVPSQPYTLGLAGTLPYLGTSLSTLYLSWNLNTEWPTSSNLLNSFLVPHETASHWLHLIEPIQVGYGAVIISFLGAIHWGLEFAEKTPSRDRTRFRYGMGVLAPAVAWPTVFMPVEWALTTQFLSFTFLYLADSNATKRGWAPQWYGTYRWVLTAVVGVAIFISLVGRAKVGENRVRLRSEELRDLLRQKSPGTDSRHDWAKEEEEERARIRKEKEEQEKRKKEEEKKKKEEEKKSKDKKGGSKKEDSSKKEGDSKKGGSKEEGESKKAGDAQKKDANSKEEKDVDSKKDGDKEKE